MDDDGGQSRDFMESAAQLQGLTLQELGGWLDLDDPELDEDMREFALEHTAEERAEDNRKAALLAGALWDSALVMVDQLFEDLRTLDGLRREPEPHDIDGTWVLSSLPERYAHRYGVMFTRRFIASTVELFLGLGNGGWQTPSCVAQELAVWCLLDQVEVTVDTYDLDVEDDWQGTLTEVLLEDIDSRMLYEPSMDGIEDDRLFAMDNGVASMAFDDWFKPFNQGSRLGPFTKG